jgi:hypothetical protein
MEIDGINGLLVVPMDLKGFRFHIVTFVVVAPTPGHIGKN